MAATEALLFGRRTWQAMAAAWPDRAGDPFADRMNEIRNTWRRGRWPPDLTWRGSTLLPADDAIGAVRELRARDGQALQVMGSASLAAQLIAHGLVDEYRLMIEPILLGGGKRLFPDDGSARALELVSAATTATGVLICTYRPARPLTSSACHRAKPPCGTGGTDYACLRGHRARGMALVTETSKVGHDSRTAHRRQRSPVQLSAWPRLPLPTPGTTTAMCRA